MSEDISQAVFLGYEEVALSRAVNGKSSVKVKCLPVRKLAEYAALIDNEPELIGLATELTADEIDMLTPDDSGKLFRKVHELNFNPFSQWLKRKAEALKLKVQALNGSSSANSSDGSSQTAV